MGTLLNTAKEARKINKEAKSAQEESVFWTEVRADGEHAIGFYADKKDVALKLTSEAIGMNKAVIKELEKDSKVKEYYESSIESNNKFVDDVKETLIKAFPTPEVAKEMLN